MHHCLRLNRPAREKTLLIWRDKAFVLFWSARVVSISGSTITAVVLPILVFQLTGSALQTALLATLEVLPYFAFGLFAGALADRIDRKRLMVGAGSFEAAADYCACYRQRQTNVEHQLSLEA